MSSRPRTHPLPARGFNHLANGLPARRLLFGLRPGEADHHQKCKNPTEKAQSGF
jgi:hypothetical protein